MSKRKGTRNEHRSKKLLEAQGFAVTRAAGSLGLFDLVAIGATKILLVQVKSNRFPGRAEVEGLARRSAYSGADAFPDARRSRRLKISSLQKIVEKFFTDEMMDARSLMCGKFYSGPHSRTRAGFSL
jgi:Holliday junction resolvase